MRKTTIPNKLNRKPMLGCVKKTKKIKKTLLVKYFAVKRSTLEACRRTVTQQITKIFATQILYSIKVLVL